MACLVLRSNFRDARLIHHGEPEIALRVEFEIERSRRFIRPQRRYRVIGDLAGRRVQFADELMAEIRVPDHAVGIHDDIVRLRVFARQVVFGDDDAGRAALQPRQRLEREVQGLRVAQVNAGEIVGHLLLDRRRHRRAVGVVAAGEQRLRLERRRARRISAHALEYLHELGVVVGRLYDALQGVAADAVGQLRLAPVVAGQTHEPFAVGELIRQRIGLAQREVGRRRAVARYFGRLRPLQDITDRADRERIVPRRQARARKAIDALFVGHHTGGDVGAVAPGADQHAFHDRLLRRRHFASQRCAVLRLRGGGHEKADEAGEADGREGQECLRWHVCLRSNLCVPARFP